MEGYEWGSGSKLVHLFKTTFELEVYLIGWWDADLVSGFFDGLGDAGLIESQH